MKIRLDEDHGVPTDSAIEVAAEKLTPSGRVTVTIWNGDTSTSIELPAEQARQVAAALIAAFGGGGDAG